MGARQEPKKLQSGRLQHLRLSLTHQVICVTLQFKILLNESLFILIFHLHCFTSITDRNFDDGLFQESEESSQFRQEYEMRRLKQASSISDLCLVCNLNDMRRIISLVSGPLSPKAMQGHQEDEF